MGLRNPKREELQRLETKTLDAQFRTVVGQGLNCSPFEAEAVLNVVKEVYFPFLNGAGGQAPPGKITVVAVSADEPAGKPIKDCEKCTVCLTVHRGAPDDQLLQREGTDAFRQARIPELCQEAMSQGALLTREDLAYRIFFVGTRTISRDLALLRQKDPSLPIPLRSTVKDIGPVLTHRTQIVRLALQGKTTTEICRILRHSPPAVANYLSTFTRCAQLQRRGMQAGQIAFLLRRGVGLIQRYLDLLAECERDKNFAYHLQQLLELGQVEEKKTGGRRSAHER
jgi:DNA-binding CsgD family transcriptional regulator